MNMQPLQTTTRCPACGKPLRDLERVVAKHTPASVPEHAKGYAVTRNYTLARCENGHDFRVSGGKGPIGWRNIESAGPRETVWRNAA